MEEKTEQKTEKRISELIGELAAYGIRTGLVDPADSVYTVNRLLEVFRQKDYQPGNPETAEAESPREVADILRDMTEWAAENGVLEQDTAVSRDLFDTCVMGCLTPPPSAVRRMFREKYRVSPKTATDWFYRFSTDTNYIRRDRIRKDVKWKAETEFGALDITINLSKPEKDPRDIAAAGKAKKSGYPACALCMENEGYAGHLTHPARQNHRIIPLILDGESYYLQYSPYVYYNEHCIILNEKHIPMVINGGTFRKLLDFVRQFPHYTAGSNADLPIVGGSILSHDHFQGGGYEFPMVRAPYEKHFEIPGAENVEAGIIRWPLSTIRLRSESAGDLARAAERVLTAWRSYDDPACFIYHETEGADHNTITPIARMREGKYELDLVLRNNITTKEYPLGYFHPHPEYHHIKKENIGLIEVMGLAVLPARLKQEMAELEDRILCGQDLRESERTKAHADWAESWIAARGINPAQGTKGTGGNDEANPGGSLLRERLHGAVQEEIGIVFAKVLECAGVFKYTKKGREGFDRFLDSLR